MSTETLDFPALKAARDKLTAKRAELAGIFDEAGPDFDMANVKSLDGDSTAKVEEIRKRNAEIDELAKKAEDLKFLGQSAASTKGDPAAAEAGTEFGSGRKSTDDTDQPTSLTAEFVASDAYKTKGVHSDISVKTLLQTTAGFAPDDLRIPVIVPIAKRPVELVDLIPKFATNQASITWMEQTTRTNTAAETGEGLAKPEATIVYTERTSIVRKIAVTLPVTDEQLEDVPQLRTVLELDLVEMIRQRLSDQIAAGDGAGVNLRGILNTSGIQTQAKGADPTPDAVYKAMVLVMTTGQAFPDAFVTNPLDWQDVRLLRTADGIYIWGNPADAGPERIWGLNVVLAQGMTQNTGVVGDWAHYARLAVRKEVTFDIGYVNDDFTKNRQTLRAEMRAALFFLRPSAFCSVTGI